MKKSFKSDMPTMDELNPALQFITPPTAQSGEQHQEAEIKPAAPHPERQPESHTATHQAQRATGTAEQPAHHTLHRKELKSRTVHILMQPSTYNSLKEYADQYGQSVNETINFILKEFLENGNK